MMVTVAVGEAVPVLVMAGAMEMNLALATAEVMVPVATEAEADMEEVTAVEAELDTVLDMEPAVGLGSVVVAVTQAARDPRAVGEEGEEGTVQDINVLFFKCQIIFYVYCCSKFIIPVTVL